VICGNYKIGEDPSLDQQIRDDSENLYETYKDTNYISAYCDALSGPVHNLTKGTYYDTIQAALDDADSGDTIEVSDGTYDESITFPSAKIITLRSVNGPSSTTISGNNGSNTFTFDDSLTGTTIEGFTITHTSGNKGRGIYVGNSYLTINNCIVSGNSAKGGGIYNVGTLIISASTISGNHASGGGGHTYYGASGGGISNVGTLIISASTISGNSADDFGGGIYIYSVASVVINIGGSSDADKNTICGNYQTFYDPSLDQQIGDSSGSLHETYEDTNYISAYCK